MKKVYVSQTLIGVAVLLAMTAAMAQHVPIPDAASCPTACDTNAMDPAVCATFPTPPDAGSDCFSGPDPCIGIWPTAPFAGMPTWGLLVYGDFDGTDFVLSHIDEVDPFTVDLPTVGTWDFCAMADQLFCSLAPIAYLAPEISAFSSVVQCQNMDLNGVINTCTDIPIEGNGIPDQYELAILAAVLNDSGHALHTAAVDAMQTNNEALATLIITALSAVDVGGAPLDVRGLTYLLSPWVMPTLGGVLSAFAATGDELTLTALDELLGLLVDLGVTPPAGGIVAITDAVPETGQSGDISGNGFSNREIYEWFIQINPAMTVAEYVALALDPLTVVPANVSITGGGAASTNDAVTLTVNLSNVDGAYSASNYTWYKWGLTGGQVCKNPPTCDEFCDEYDWIVLPGETGSALTFAAAQVTDSGEYACDVEMDDGSKAVTGTIMARTTLVVTDASGVPVGGALGLTLLAGACALAGAVGIRRRK